MRSLGVDIGTTNIKIVELSGSGNEISLENYGVLETYSYLERPNAAIQSSYFKIVEEITGDLLKKLLATLKPKTRRSVISLPIFSSFVTVFEVPFHEEKEISRAIPFEAKKYIPLPLGELTIDWAIIGEPEAAAKNVGAKILLIAIPKELIQRYQKIAKDSGLDAVAFELESVALGRSLVGQEKSPVLILDIGSQSSNLAVIDNGYLVSNESLTTAGAEITHVLAQGLGISKERAEEFKRVKGFNVTPQEAEVVNLMLPIIDYLGSEISRAMNIYKERTGRDIKKVMLAGGTANLPGLDGYLSQALNLDIQKAWPFNHISYQQFLEPLLKEIGPSLSVATGLALREMR
jgi:type IV pilus assembly protein PilM